MSGSSDQHIEAVLPTKEFPADVVDLILDNLRDSPATLSSCALVSRVWRFVACPLLFRRLRCSGTRRGARRHKKSFADFIQFLRGNPRICVSVEELELSIAPRSSHRHADTIVLNISNLCDIMDLTPYLRILKLSNVSLVASETSTSPALPTRKILDQLILNEFTKVPPAALTEFFALFADFSILHVDMPLAATQSYALQQKGHSEPKLSSEAMSGILRCNVQPFDICPDSSEDSDTGETIEERATYFFGQVVNIIRVVGHTLGSVTFGPFPADFGLPFDLSHCYNLRDISVKIDVVSGLDWDSARMFGSAGLLDPTLERETIFSIVNMLDTVPANGALSDVRVVIAFQERLLAGDSDTDQDRFLNTLDEVIRWQHVVDMVVVRHHDPTFARLSFLLVSNHSFRDSYPQEIVRWIDQNSLGDDMRDRFHSSFQISLVHWNAYQVLVV
ncbi:hypothetical protein BDW22DRAFT_1363554 [Trametopsis cervina]|nr:hypothetical protein BDW22DRAFT_1363554 [Trametopsis cervina]